MAGSLRVILKTTALVFLGGALGSGLRFILEITIGFSGDKSLVPLGYLFIVNLSGSFFLGLTAKHPRFSSGFAKNFWATGFAGGFTTMSALSLLIFDAGWHPLIWLMLLLGVFSYGLGYKFGRREATRTTKNSGPRLP